MTVSSDIDIVSLFCNRISFVVQIAVTMFYLAVKIHNILTFSRSFTFPLTYFKIALNMACKHDMQSEEELRMEHHAFYKYSFVVCFYKPQFTKWLSLTNPSKLFIHQPRSLTTRDTPSSKGHLKPLDDRNKSKYDKEKHISTLQYILLSYCCFFFTIFLMEIEAQLSDIVDQIIFSWKVIIMWHS